MSKHRKKGEKDKNPFGPKPDAPNGRMHVSDDTIASLTDDRILLLADDLWQLSFTPTPDDMQYLYKLGAIGLWFGVRIVRAIERMSQ